MKEKKTGGWFFVTIPKSLAIKIRDIHGASEEGWGRLNTLAIIGTTSWNTAIWYDSKIGSCIIPLKISVRKNESLDVGSLIKIDLIFDLDTWLLSID